MPLSADDLALLHIVLINTALVAGASLIARRFSQDAIQIALDTLLLWFTTQYLTVGLLGIIGCLTPALISILALAASIALAALGLRRPATVTSLSPANRNHWLALCAALFVLGYIASYAFAQRLLPPTATDALAYHLPTAINWLQQRSISIWPAWYWNPANAYSPMAAETFIVWLLAPAGNDVFARYVQIMPLLLVFLAVVQLCRAAGTPVRIAALAGAALVLSRPMLSQALLVKDDLVMAAFFGLTAVALTANRLREPVIGPIRLGLSLGLFLAVKYPALLMLPPLLLLCDGPTRSGWRWKSFALAAAIACLIAGPWYLRNLALGGSPLFPAAILLHGRTLLPGLFTVARHPQLSSIASAWRVLSEGYHGLHLSMLLPLCACNLLLLALKPRQLARDPVLRFCALAPITGFASFLLLSPLPEVRFFFPSLLPFAACAAIAVFSILPRTRRPFADVVMLLLLAGALATGFGADYASRILEFVLCGLFAIALGVAAIMAWRATSVAARSAAITALAAVFSLVLYVYWNAYVGLYRQSTEIAWQGQYPYEADLWAWLRDNVPDDATIAYAGTSFTYPLYGFDLRHRVEYVPTRSDLEAYGDLPFLGRDVSGYDLPDLVTQAMEAHPDLAKWHQRLLQRHIAYLIVIRTHGHSPPEFALAAALPDLFTKRYETPVGTIFQVKQ